MTSGRQAERCRHGIRPGDQHSTKHHILAAAGFPEHIPHSFPNELGKRYHHLPTMSIGIFGFSVFYLFFVFLFTHTDRRTDNDLRHPE